jgi:AraC family transcriptional regulator, L-rhamnose operon transcriptional activator RhaR
VYQFTSSEVFGRSGKTAGSALIHVGEGVAPHGHDFLEMAIVLAGCGEHMTQRGSTPLGEGAVLVVRPGQWHGYDSCDELDVFNVYVLPEAFGRELSWILDYPPLARFLLNGGRAVDTLDAVARNRVRGWLSYLEELGGDNSPSAEILSAGLLDCVLGEIANLTFDTEDREGGIISPPVRDAMRLISLNPEVQWTMAELSGRVHASVSHLHRQFSAQVGMAPMAWLGGLRTERAAVLLLQGDLPIAEIGKQVGWLDASYVSRRFRQAYGMSPREYRSRFGFSAGESRSGSR